MRQEREKFMNKISKLETNISTWENNLGFISAESNEANSMIQDFKEKIKNAREEIELLEEKVKLIDKLEDEEE
jgi:peptidoglycan hydrolase CwlO-like protein